MTEKMNKTHKEKIIPIKDAAHILGILEIDLDKWLENDKPILSKDYLDRLGVTEDFINRCASKPDYKEAVLKAIRSEVILRAKDEISKQSERLRDQRLSLLNDYKKYIQDLEKLHQKYLDIIDLINDENGLSAAYILFFKVISLLYLTSDCIRNGYWFSGSFLREIDETLDVAHYFIIAENTDTGQKNLKKWFRLNKAPKHKVCRETISKYQSLINPNHNEDNNRSLMNELYDKKSKWVHPTLNAIREIMIFKECDGKLSTAGYDYRSCTFERKLNELTHFFRSSIWTAYQVFFFCFFKKMPLKQEDKDIILRYNRLFNEIESSIDW